MCVYTPEAVEPSIRWWKAGASVTGKAHCYYLSLGSHHLLPGLFQWSIKGPFLSQSLTHLLTRCQHCFPIATILSLHYSKDLCAQLQTKMEANVSRCLKSVFAPFHFWSTPMSRKVLILIQYIFPPQFLPWLLVLASRATLNNTSLFHMAEGQGDIWR